MRPFELTYEEARALLDSRRLSSRELCESVLDRVEDLDPVLHAFIHVRERSDVLREAETADRERAAGRPRGRLVGVPVAVKDNIACDVLPTTAGSRALRDHVSPYEATAVRRLREAGAVVVGKTNLDEFAMGSSCENSAFGPTLNPWDLSRVPGGSSGGSAAAVAAGMATLALGSDTGGSVRQPAGFCGIVGFLPSYGNVSRYGLVAFASSLDQIGPMSRDVAGAAALFDAVSGHDPRDSTSRPGGIPEGDAASPSHLCGLKVGLPVDWLAEGVEPSVRSVFRRAVDSMREAGVELREIGLPLSRHAVAAYHVVADAEASTNLARYDGVGYGSRARGASDIEDVYRATRGQELGLEAKRRIILGTFVLSEGHRDQYYRRAQNARLAMAVELDAAFEVVDLIASPTSPGAAFRLGERVDDPLAMYMSDVFTVHANLAGLPAISLPAGCDEEGLPVGLQLMGPRGADDALLRVASACEALIGWSERPRVGSARGAP